MMADRFRLAVLCVGCLGLLGLASCKKQGGSKDEKAESQSPDKEKQKKKQQEDDSSKSGASNDGSPHSSGIPGTMNQLNHDEDIPEVDFEITAPSNGTTLSSGEKVEVEFKLDGYRIGKTIGQHVHFILDNKPYSAHYDADNPEVFENLEPGTHTLRAFPSRHYHLSLKQGKAFDTVVFHVEEKSEDFNFDPEKPYITYSRPKGTYSKEAAESMLLDFYVSNVELGSDAKVVYSIDGDKKGTLTEWKPVLLEDLSPGEHEINLKLVDSDGNVIENGGYNDTTRTIQIEE